MDVVMENVDETPQVRKDYDAAQDVEDQNPDQAKKVYTEIIKSDQESEEGMKCQELAVYALGKLYVKQNDSNALAQLTTEIRPFCAHLPKARTAKIVRTLIDLMAKIDGTIDKQIQLCEDCVAWCHQEKRTFLRQRVETKLAALFVETKQFAKAEAILENLIKEVKKLDDKLLLTEIHLIEAHLYFDVNNIPKAKAALTTSKTKANAIHCPPLLQAEIDMRSGVICARDNDFGTAYSYFYEGFEAFHQSADKRAYLLLKYMLLAKVMNDQAGDVAILAAGKTYLKYMGPGVEALLAVAKAYKARSLIDFENTVLKHKAVLSEDPIVNFHITALNETLLEQNLIRILEPYEKVQIQHVAKLIDLPVDRVLSKLTLMILDGKFEGTLDQGNGHVIIFDKEQINPSYEHVLKSIQNTNTALGTMNKKANKLFV